MAALGSDCIRSRAFSQVKPTTMSYNTATIYCSDDQEEEARDRADELGLNLSVYTRKLWERDREESILEVEDDD